MKIGEAQQHYSTQINELWNRKRELLAQKKEAQAHGGASQALLDELQAVSAEHEKMSAFMEEFTNYKTALQNIQAARQQGEAEAKSMQDLAKCMEISRRISNGDHVPPSDEEKLMNYSMELYLAAKNAGMLKQDKDSKDYDSLWEEEEGDTPPVEDNIDDTECTMEGPDLDLV